MRALRRSKETVNYVLTLGTLLYSRVPTLVAPQHIHRGGRVEKIIMCRRYML